jgi:hypothetical protein
MNRLLGFASVVGMFLAYGCCSLMTDDALHPLSCGSATNTTSLAAKSMPIYCYINAHLT